MPDNLFDLARSVPGLDFDEMDPLNLLAQTIERVGAVGQGKLSSAITQEDVNRWAGEIAGTVEGGRGSGWEAAEKIRSDILKWRVGQENLEVAFDMTPAQAAAAMEIGGDIAGTVMANAPTGEATFPGTINPYGYAPPQQEEDDSADSKQTILNNMKDSFQLALRNMGFEPDMITTLFNWASNKFISDPGYTAERALMEMYDHQVFKDRFPAIDQMRSAGEKAIPTPGEYIAFEKDLHTLLQQFGVQVTDIEETALVTSLIRAGVGTPEVTERLSEAERITFSVPKDVQDTIMLWFGPTWAKSIQMKMFLDPNQNWSKVQDDIKTAEVGGWGTMVAGLDLGWDSEMANQIADLGLSQAQVWNSFANLKQEEMLFLENVGETENAGELTDLEYERHGISAEFGIGADALTLDELINRRKERRISRFRGGGTGQAGAMITGSTTGIGAANA